MQLGKYKVKWKRLFIIKWSVLLSENIESLLSLLKRLLENKKYLLDIGIFLLEIGLLGLIFFVAREFTMQVKIADNLKTLQRELIYTTLPLTNLLSKTKGNIEFIEHSIDQIHTIDVKPALYYSKQQKTHKLEVVLLNPSYTLMDCSGEIISNVIYPVKINFVWRPMKHAKEQYELVCERYINSKSDKSKAFTSKVLLQHINAVKFKFLGQTTSGGFKAIEPKKLNKEDPNYIQDNDIDSNNKIVAIQIGMLVQSATPLYRKVRHNKYYLFNEPLSFFDQFNRKVIYITAETNLS